MREKYNPAWTMPALADNGRHYVVKGEFDAARDNFHVSFGKPKMNGFDLRYSEKFAVVGWFAHDGREDFFVMPYAAVRHLFQVKPNKGTGWHVYVVRSRFYVVSETYGAVDVTACRSDRPDVRRLITASLDRDEPTVKALLAMLTAACKPE